MKLKIDPTRCEAYGVCVQHVPEALALDEWGYASVVGDGAVDSEDAGRKAIRECPTRAVLEAD